MTVRAVIFDLGGVVLGSPIQAILEYERGQGLAAGFLGGLVLRTGHDGAWGKLERGELDMAAFCQAFDAEALAAGGRISSVALMARMAELSQPRPAMVNAIRRIRAAGLRACALTNNWDSDDQQHKMDLLRAEFDLFIESFRIGMRKPDPRIYELACSRLEVAPNEAVFLDDIGANLKTARALGLTTIKVDAPDVALAELEGVLGIALR